MTKRFFSLIVVCYILCSCQKTISIESITADNFFLLKAAEANEQDENTYPIWSAFRFVSGLEVVGVNPKGKESQIQSIRNIDSYNPIYKVENFEREISITDLSTMDYYVWRYKENSNRVEGFKVAYNYSDPSHIKRFNDQLDAFLRKEGGIYRETERKRGRDIIIVPSGDYYLIGEIWRAKDENNEVIMFVDFKVYHKYNE
ncbi:hypothetical protein JYG30_04105 [Fibrella sp. USSR17]